MKFTSRSVFTLLLVVALAALLTTSGCGPKETAGAPETPPGAPTTDLAPQPQVETPVSESPADNSGLKKAPSVTGATLDGKPFDLASYKGKVVVVDFWATWCAPCVHGIPDLMALQEKYGKQGFQILGFSVDRNKADVESFVAEKKINYPIVIVDQAVAEAWGGVNAIPTTFILNKDGYIAKDFVGLTPAEELEATFTPLL